MVSTAPAPPPFRIGFASSAQDLHDIAELFREYTGGLGIDLAYQSFAEELAGLPGKYAAPHGVLLLARKADGDGNLGKPIGCVAVRPLPFATDSPSTSSKAVVSRCELKRLYVRPDARGTRLGEALAQRAITEAAARGYGLMVMDTLTTMAAAQRLYAKLGFATTEAYYETPIANTVFFQRTLP